MEHNASEHSFLQRPNWTILTLAVPVTLSLVAEPITGMVDTAFVARLGAAPLAGLGIGTTALSVMFWVLNFLSISAQTEVARASGAKNYARTAQITSLALIVGVILSGLVALIFIPAAGLVSMALGAEGAVLEDANIYLQLRLLGAPAVLTTLIGFGVLRGLQDMRTPLWIAVLINVLNIILDAVLIFGLEPIPALGVAGSALASTIAQWIGAALVLWSIARRFGLIWYFRLDEVRVLLRVGGDLFLRTALLNVFMLLSTRIANQISPEAGAAHQVIRTVWLFTGLLLDGMAITVQSLVGYFLGIGRVEVARKAALLTLRWGLVVGVALAVGMLLLTDGVIVLLAPGEGVAYFVLMGWWIASLTQPLNAMAFVTDGIHWGTGDYTFLRNAMLVATLVGSIGLLLISPAAENAFAWIWTVTAIWIALRMILGVGRVWPGFGNSPLRPDQSKLSVKRLLDF